MNSFRTSGITVATAPGCPPRLLRTTWETEDLGAYLAEGGYGPISSAAAVLEQVRAAGLRGRGGAAFPLATKLATVRKACVAGQRTVVVANGEEGEPVSVKDKWLLRTRPHLVLDGVRIAAAVVGADHARRAITAGRAAPGGGAARTDRGPAPPP
ncbi:NADH-ubiquinone oxidoreductase-F iron-sulfur binding region domain-containing protein, partial [Nocardia sp. NPDC055321]